MQRAAASSKTAAASSAAPKTLIKKGQHTIRENINAQVDDHLLI
jgi:hypothetical protein